MKTSLKRLTFILAFLPLLSCSCRTELEEINLHEAVYVENSISIALELGWGKGDYSVGYADDFIINNADKGTTIGPTGYSVDEAGNLITDDYFNNRYLKHDKNGMFVGEVSKDIFSTRSCHFLAGYEHLYVATPDLILFRYSFEDNALLSIEFSDLGNESSEEVYDLAYDKEESIYVFTKKDDGLDTITSVYKIDSSLSMVFEKRELPSRSLRRYCVDSSGDLFYIYSDNEDNVNQSVFRIDKNNKINKAFTIVRQEEDDLYHLKLIEITENDDFFLYYYSNGDRIARISSNGVLMGYTALTTNTKFSVNEIDIPNADSIYFSESRPYNKDDKSPYRIYKSEPDW